MTRLIDRILASPIDAETRDTLRQCPVIAGDAVSDYYYMGTGQERWEIGRDFPNLAPPYKEFFLDFRPPAYIQSDERGRTAWDPANPCAWGLLIEGTELSPLLQDPRDPEQRRQFADAVGQRLLQTWPLYSTFGFAILKQAGGDTARAYEMLTAQQREVVDGLSFCLWLQDLIENDAWDQIYEVVSSRADLDETRWHLSIRLFLEYLHSDNQREICEEWFWSIPVTGRGLTVPKAGGPDGRAQYTYGPLGKAAQDFSIGQVLGERDVLEQMHARGGTLEPLVYPGLLLISFLHCKNVSLRKVIPARQNMNNKQRRRGLKPFQPHPYYVLNIEPLRRILRTEGRSEQVGLQRSLHICRGHFADYRQGAGLFGKHKGIYWFPQQLRGALVKK